MRLLLLVVPFLAVAQDWPQFRGPSGQGHGTGTSLPVTWSETESIRWKVPVQGRGWSSPSILGNRIWLTTAINIPSGKYARSLRAIAVDKASGKQLVDAEVFQPGDAGEVHVKNSYASPTPVLEGDLVFVHYGKLGTACLRSTGEIVWKTKFDYDHNHGTGGSPVLYKDLLIVACDGSDIQYLAALDKRTGQIRWKRSRPKPAYMAFSTPLVIEAAGRTQLISTGGHQTVSYDPETGKELWLVTYGDGFSNVPRPTFAHGLVYLFTGFYQPHVYAVRPDGSGDVTNSHVAWRYGRSVPLTPSPIIVGEEFYMVSDNGILSCLNAKTGQPIYQQRLGGNFSASPIHADGRLYFPSEEGETHVIAPGPQFRRLAVNRVEGQTMASIAVSGSDLFLRSASHLYRIGKTGN